jgi:hypothetical protein
MEIDRTDKYLPDAYRWMRQMPEWFLRLADRENESFEEYAADIEPDLKFTTVIEGHPQAFITAEAKGNDWYDVHVLTQRRQAAGIVRDSIFMVRDELQKIAEVKWCSFSFPTRQKVIENALLECHAVDSGWKYRSNRVTYKTLVWEVV